MYKFLLVVLLSLSLGCAGLVGVSKPVGIFKDPEGNTVVQYEVKGVSFALGSAHVGHDNVHGGEFSDNFVDFTTSVVNSVGRIVGGILMGFGSAGAAISPDE